MSDDFFSFSLINLIKIVHTHTVCAAGTASVNQLVIVSLYCQNISGK